MKTKTQLALNLVDSHDVADFSDVTFAAGIKFLQEHYLKHNVYTHCQLGVSRSASLIFIFLVVNQKLQGKNFSEALTEHLQDFYPFMKLNYGIYQFLKTNFPFKKIHHLSKLDWEELVCIT